MEFSELICNQIMKVKNGGERMMNIRHACAECVLGAAAQQVKGRPGRHTTLSIQVQLPCFEQKSPHWDRSILTDRLKGAMKMQ